MLNYLTKEEEVKLTEQVILYNSTDDEKKKSRLKRFVFAKTELLLYMIPKTKGFLEEEYLADFFLQQRNYIKDIVGAYVLTKLSYVDYLSCILRKRALAFMMRAKEKEAQDGNIVYEIGRIRAEDMLSDYASEYVFESTNEKHYKPSLMKTLEPLPISTIANALRLLRI